jgi:hypothetical protein
VLFGQEYCAPINTALTDHEQSFRDLPYPQGLKSLGDRMKVLRDIIHENIKDARATTERIKNVNAKPHDFQEGQRVFISQELESNKIKCRKSFPEYVGPYSILEIRGTLVRLQHWNTGKILKNYIHVSKLKRLKDESRDKLYNRLRPANSQDSTMDVDQQPTVQTALTATSSYWQPTTEINSLDADARNNLHPTRSQQINTADAADYNITHTAIAEPIMLTHASIVQPAVHNDSRQSPAHCSITHAQRLRPHAYSPTSQAMNANAAWPTESAELPTRPMQTAHALKAMIHRPQAVSDLQTIASHLQPIITQQDSRPHYPAAAQAAPPRTTAQMHYSPPLTGDIRQRPPLLQSLIQPDHDRGRPVIFQDSMHPSGIAINNDLARVPHQQMAATHQPRVHNQGTAGSIDLTELEAANAPMNHALRADEMSCNQNNTVHPVSSDPQTLTADTELQSLAQARPTTHHMDSNKVLPAAAENQPAQTKLCLVRRTLTPNTESYQAMTDPPQLGYNTDIVRVSACRRRKPNALYKVYFKNQKESQWVPVTRIPPKLLASFYVRQFQKKMKKKLRV